MSTRAHLSGQRFATEPGQHVYRVTRRDVSYPQLLLCDQCTRPLDRTTWIEVENVPESGKRANATLRLFHERCWEDVA